MPDHRELKALHTALIDAAKGYEEAIRDAKDAEMKAIFEKVRGLHHHAHAVVHGLMTANGEKPDESGSFMATVHETVIGIRSAVMGLDRGSLSSFVSGEEHTLAKYDDAIAASPAAASNLAPEKAALQRAVIEMKQHAG